MPKFSVLPKILLTIIMGIQIFANLFGQNILIKDTVRNIVHPVNSLSDSLFSVEGQVIGVDSGTIKVFLPDQPAIAYVPLKNGKFYFTGITKFLDQLHIAIMGDYYDYVFYVEPGIIKIRINYHGKFTASGTEENNLSNYFYDTLSRKNSERFNELNNKIEMAIKEEQLDGYLKLIDSFTIAEKDFIKTVNEAIDQKKYGDYLLGCINYYYINFGYFKERQDIFDRLPEYLKNSPSGKRSLEYLAQTKSKNTFFANQSASQFVLKDIHGNSFSLESAKGKVIVLDFWASWCLPCLKSLPLLKNIQLNEVSKNVVYVSVSIDKKEKDWISKEEQIHTPWNSLLADEATIKNYQIAEVPCYIVINKEGKIMSKSSSLSVLYSSLKEINK